MNKSNSNLKIHPDRELIIIKNFSKFVKSYERYAILQKTMAERLAAFLKGNSTENILEIGCGTGFFTRHLLTLPFHKLLLNDLTSAMVNCLKEKIDLPQKVNLAVGNAERLTFPKMDLIAANAVFQWFQKPAATIIRLSSFLNPNGLLIFSTFGPKTLTELRQISGIESPTNLLTQSNWEKIIERSGLMVVKVEVEMKKVIFPSALTLIKTLQQSGTAPTSILRAGKLRKVIRQYDSVFTSSQGVYSTWEIFYFQAKESSK